MSTGYAGLSVFTARCSEMGAVVAEAFLMYLAVDRKVSASTQNQALSATLFLCNKCYSSLPSSFMPSAKVSASRSSAFVLAPDSRLVSCQR